MIITRNNEFTLRTWRADDVASLAAAANDVRICDGLRDAFPHPYTLRDAQAFIDAVGKQPEPCDFAVEMGGCIAGGAGFVRGSDVERYNAEIGYWLVPSLWGRGIMTAVVGALCRFVFTRTETHRIHATVFAGNAASARVLEKSGFRLAGTMREMICKNGTFRDGLEYELLKTEVERWER